MRLTRSNPPRPAAPIRILHLGVGNFFRAHQAWYTDRASDHGDWGIAAFTGRSSAIADDLAPQAGLYTLITRAPLADEFSVVSSLSAVHAATDLEALRDYFRSAELAIVTTTITEAGYCRRPDGSLDLDHPGVAADLEALRLNPDEAQVTTAIGKLVAGLLVRRTGAPEARLTLVPCDNVAGNGAMLQRVVADLAHAVDPSLGEYLDASVGYVTTMVDRITPRTTAADRLAVSEQTGVDDPAAVVTEPFSEWVLQGEFLAGRPAWHEAGARFVDDIEPFEARKLYLLNGSHSLMAYAGSLLGHTTVVEAIADARVLDWVEQWWNVASPHVSLSPDEIDDYRAALIERYRNANIRHLLAQIAADGSQKVPIRIVPVVQAELSHNRVPTAALRTIAAWTLHLRGLGAPVSDIEADQLTALVDGSLPDAVSAVLGWLGISDDRAAEETLRLAEELTSLAG